MSLKEICREKRESLKVTLQDIADGCGMSISTVNHFFTSASRAPQIDTAGPICAFLNVSLDEYYGIEPDTPNEVKAYILELNGAIDHYQSDLEDMETLCLCLTQENNALKKHIAEEQERLRFARKLYKVLIGIIIGIVVVDCILIAHVVHLA